MYMYYNSNDTITILEFYKPLRVPVFKSLKTAFNKIEMNYTEKHIHLIYVYYIYYV